MADDIFEVPGVDDLYRLDPAVFVDARNTLAKQLKSRTTGNGGADCSTTAANSSSCGHQFRSSQ